MFFSELSNSLNRVAMKYDNLLVDLSGDLNINTLNKEKDNVNYFSDLCNFFRCLGYPPPGPRPSYPAPRHHKILTFLN